MVKNKRETMLLYAAERALIYGDGYSVLQRNNEKKLYDEMMDGEVDLYESENEECELPYYYKNIRCLHICLAAAQVATGDLWPQS